ncbi:MAG TPA: DNA polymerase III subunit gamma/tau [Opitutaceae bacterium]
MSQATTPWPPSLAGTPAVAVLERAVERGRLSHGLLLAGDDAEALSGAAMALADRLLSREGPSPFPPERHPDCLQLRPANKSRQISVGAVRGLISRINVSPAISAIKVAVLHEADRMNTAAANSFLKTLEEPPADTTLLLLTTKPYALLPTIRSRVLHFRLAGGRTAVPVEGWQTWLDDYRSWLARLGKGLSPNRAADGVFGAYGLLARFSLLLDRASAAELDRRKASLPEGLEDAELEAIEAEISIGLRQRMFVATEEATRAHAHELTASGDPAAGRFLTAAIDALERDAGLLRAYLNEATALEDFLLASLRIWAKR